jgi:zinc protease
MNLVSKTVVRTTPPRSLLIFVPSRFALGMTLVAQLVVGRTAGSQEPRSTAPVTFSLANGLAVVVAEDPSVANVAVELWVRAGARYEDAGHWGQAHFFEHMFGATRLPTAPGRVLGGNAQTRRDFCRYYLLVDREAIEYAIAAQADRLDSPLSAMTAERLAANRDIVINEFRGYESRPFGFGSITDVKTLINAFGSSHPYGRPIQVNQDVTHLSDEDMKRWVVDRYRPGDALLFIAGNATVARVRPLVERYLGPIPAVRDNTTRPVARVTTEPFNPTRQRRERVTVAAPASRVFAAWATPRYGDPDADYLSLFIETLAAPEVGRLHEQLVQRDRLAESTAADTQLEELAGLIRATVSLRPGEDPTPVEAAIAEAANALARNGPTDAELRAAKARLAVRAARQWEHLGFQGSRIDLLGEGALYVGDPSAYRRRLDRIAAATRDDVTRAAGAWVDRRGYILTAVAQSAAPLPPIDRSRPVTLAAAPAPAFPSVNAKRLPNGVRLATVERPDSSLVNVAIVIPAANGSSESSQRVTVEALTDRDPGHRSRGADAWRACIAAGATIDVAVSAAATTVTIEMLAADAPLAFRAAAALLSDERIDAGTLERDRQREAARIATQDAAARTRATLASVLGGGARTGSSADRVIIAAGAFDRSALETAIASVSTDRAAPPPDQESAPSSTLPAKGAMVYVIDEPGRVQTVLAAGHGIRLDATASFARARVAAAVLSARLSANLREQHQWAYNAQAAPSWAADGTPTMVIATEVQTDHAADAIAEIRRECDRPVTAAESGRLATYRRDLVQQIAGNTDSTEGIITVVADFARRGMPVTSATELLREATALDARSIADALQLVQGQSLRFVLTGDAQILLPQLKAAGIDAVRIGQ